ncbi:hypothetical protein ACF0H5_011391 [Mactra antiquata]
MASMYTAVFVLVAVYFENVYCCDSSWIGHNNRCYLFSHDTEYWIGALQMCRELGAQLVEIETAAENTYLKAQAQVYAKDQFWISLTDIGEEGSWMWMSSKASINTTGFSDWYPGQPDNHGVDQNCAALYINRAHHAPSWQWSDIACASRNHYICEKPAGEGEVIG